MDYFLELLESYNKLKKRKFKLTYINEEDTKKKPAAKEEEEEPIDPAVKKAAESLANKAISSAKPLPNSTDADTQLEFITKVDGTPSTLKIFLNQAQNNVTVLGLGAQGGPMNVAKKGTIVPKAFEALVKRLGDDEKLGGAQQAVVDSEAAEAEAAAEAELERLMTLEKLGGALELAGRDPKDLKPILASLNRTAKAMKHFCDNLDPNNTEGSLKNMCGRPAAYLAGASKSGFEYKLSKGVSLPSTLERKLVGATALSIDPLTGKRIGMVPLEIGLISEVVESHADLSDFLTGEGDCDTIKDKVGFFKDSVVLFGSNPTEGVAFKPNALQKISMEKVKQECKDVDLTEVISDEFKHGEINAVKGTFNELTLQLTVKLMTAKTQDERKKSFKEIAKRIEEKRQLLSSYAASVTLGDDIALDIGSFFDKEILLEQAGISKSSIALKDWFLKEVSMQLGFVKMMEADDVIPVGKEVITGAREDTLLLYSDEKKAKAAAAKIGSSAAKGESGWTVGVGQKRITKLHEVKLGEINSTSRMMDILTGTVKTDRNLAAGFEKRIDDMQFAGDEGRLQQSKDWMSRLEKKISKATESLATYSTYLDNTGKIKSIKPEERIKTIAASTKNILSFDELKKSQLGKALFGNKGDYRDYKDVSTQLRTQEVVQREARFKNIKDGIELGDQAAEDSLVRMALICGANAAPMGQFVVENSGDSYFFSHNEALEEVAKANKNRTLEVSINGTTATMTTANGISISFSQEGTWGGGKRNTRSKTKLSKATVEKLNRQTEKQEENTLYKFLRGQMELLESILSQSKHSLSL